MLKEILNIVKLRGIREIKEAKIEVNKNEVIINAMSPDTSIVVSIKSDKDKTNIDKTIGIKNIEAIVKYLDLAGDKKSVEIKGNRLVIKGGKRKMSALLKDVQFVKTEISSTNVNKFLELVKDGETIFVDVSKLKVIEDYLKATGSNYFKLQLGKNQISIIIDEDNTDNIKDVIEVIGEGKSTLILGETFLDAISVLTGQIKIIAKENAPVILIQETENYVATIIVGQQEIKTIGQKETEE